MSLLILLFFTLFQNFLFSSRLLCFNCYVSKDISGYLFISFFFLFLLFFFCLSFSFCVSFNILHIIIPILSFFFPTFYMSYCFSFFPFSSPDSSLFLFLSVFSLSFLNLLSSLFLFLHFSLFYFFLFILSLS